jgi:predicted nuclease with RNAse H fold
MKSVERLWIGADPGGKKSFGLAMLQGDSPVRTVCVSSAREALEWIKGVPDGAGIDAPM